MKAGLSLCLVLLLLGAVVAQKDSICPESNSSCGSCRIVTLSEDAKTLSCKECSSGSPKDPKPVSEVKEVKELCSLPGWVIPVIVVGAVFVIVIIVSIVCFCRRKSQATQAAGNQFMADNQMRAAAGNPMNPAFSADYVNNALHQINFKPGPGQDPRNPYPQNHGLNSFSQAPVLPSGFR